MVVIILVGMRLGSQLACTAESRASAWPGACLGLPAFLLFVRYQGLIGWLPFWAPGVCGQTALCPGQALGEQTQTAVCLLGKRGIDLLLGRRAAPWWPGVLVSYCLTEWMSLS